MSHMDSYSFLRGRQFPCTTLLSVYPMCTFVHSCELCDTCVDLRTRLTWIFVHSCAQWVLHVDWHLLPWTDRLTRRSAHFETWTQGLCKPRGFLLIPAQWTVLVYKLPICLPYMNFCSFLRAARHMRGFSFTSHVDFCSFLRGGQFTCATFLSVYPM